MVGIGLVLGRSPAGAQLKTVIEGLFEVSMTLIGLVIRIAPLAVACFMFNLAALFGWELLGRLGAYRSEEHTSELQSLTRISYAVFCLKKKNLTYTTHKKYQYSMIIQTFA